jgi:lysophospholipase L1-like esterase
MRNFRPRTLAALLALGGCLSSPGQTTAVATNTSFRFDLGSGAVEPGYIQVLSHETYTRQRGFGFEPGTDIRYISRVTAERPGDFCTSDGAFYFSVAVPEGNYRITVTVGDLAGESNTTIKAELRRLMLEDVTTSAGQIVTRSFVVNVRTPQIAGGDRQVRLKDREKKDEQWAWDEKLTLEFNGKRPAVCAIQIEKVDVPTVYLLGDSTVADQPREPWNSWGQMLPRWFDDRVAIANHAESGESLRSALSANRLAKVLSLIKPGDYLLIQFGHNDMKEKGEGIGAFTSYKSDLKHFIAEGRARGATVFLVTSCERKAGAEKDTLSDYPEAVRQTARERSLPLIDLHAMSKVFYKSLGSNLDKAFQDGTHHNNYGSYELAKCVVEGIRQSKLPLAEHIVSDFKGFDPPHPDPVVDFHIAPSTQTSATAPLGN